MEYKNMFEKGKIGNLEIKNKIVFPAMGIALATPAGEATDEMISYYEERAIGGAGLIIVGTTNVDDEIRGNLNPYLEATDGIHSHNLQKLANAIHKHGSKVFLQLDHPGRETALLASYSSKIVGPSAIPSSYSNIIPQVLTTKEVKRLIGKFVISAYIAKKSGFDGVEVNAAHGFLISQFLSPHTNVRTDKYGGSFSNRLNFLVETVLGIKEICGLDFPICVRFNGDDFYPGGLTLEDSIEIGKKLEEVGVDILNVTSGTFETPNKMVEPNSYKEGWKKNLAKTIKEHVSIPVLACNAIKSPETAESLLEEGVCDFVGIARGMLADSHWVMKARENKSDTIRKCLSCLDCMDAICSGRIVRCAINPRLALEKNYPYENYPKTSISRPVVVIGGGPSGLEASITLRKRGFKVILFEKENKLGGNINLYKNIPTRESMSYLLESQIRELTSLGVDLRLEKEPSLEELEEIDPYAIYIATGGVGVEPDYEGIDSPKVLYAKDVLKSGMSFYNKSIIVIGSDLRQLSIADYISEDDNFISIFEKENKISPNVERNLVSDVLSRLNKKRVEININYELLSITDKGARFLNRRNLESVEFPADYILFLKDEYSVRQETFVEDIKDRFRNVFLIGDADLPINLTYAVRTGFLGAYNL